MSIIKRISIVGVIGTIFLGLSFTADSADRSGSSVSWRQMLHQAPEWYSSQDAIRIGDNLLLYQRGSGGWPKNTDMTRVLNESDREKIREDKRKTDSTFDNSATTTELRFLARAYDATKVERFKDGFLKGLDFIFKAQYDNGGWPQFYPLEKGYSRHITFNDGAMIKVMSLLQDIVDQKKDFTFVDDNHRKKSGESVQKGIECILKCQIRVDGKLTAWCAQHDCETLEPQTARTYELPSISGSESVGIVRFLMGIENPNPEIVEAIQSAAAWFDGPAKLTGIRQTYRQVKVEENGSTVEKRDRVIVDDPAAPPVWARFYEIETNRPFFCSRDGIKRFRLEEISYERRNGYSWYGSYAGDLLEKDYPAWQQKWAKDRNVLQH